MERKGGGINQLHERRRPRPLCRTSACGRFIGDVSVTSITAEMFINAGSNRDEAKLTSGDSVTSLVSPLGDPFTDTSRETFVAATESDEKATTELLGSDTKDDASEGTTTAVTRHEETDITEVESHAEKSLAVSSRTTAPPPPSSRSCTSANSRTKTPATKLSKILPLFLFPKAVEKPEGRPPMVNIGLEGVQGRVRKIRDWFERKRFGSSEQQMGEEWIRGRACEEEEGAKVA